MDWKETARVFDERAVFYTIADMKELLRQTGFSILSGCTTLYQQPGEVSKTEPPRPGLDETGGFVVVAATRG